MLDEITRKRVGIQVEGVISVKNGKRFHQVLVGDDGFEGWVAEKSSLLLGFSFFEFFAKWSSLARERKIY